MNRFYEILGNNSDILEFDSRSYKINALVKLRTDLEGEIFKLDYKDISLIQSRSDRFLSDTVAGFMVYNTKDDTVLLNLDNILEISFDKNIFDIIENMVRVDDEIDSLLQKDNKNARDCDRLSVLFTEKRLLKKKL